MGPSITLRLTIPAKIQMTNARNWTHIHQNVRVIIMSVLCKISDEYILLSLPSTVLKIKYYNLFNLEYLLLSDFLAGAWLSDYPSQAVHRDRSSRVLLAASRFNWPALSKPGIQALTSELLWEALIKTGLIALMFPSLFLNFKQVSSWL